MTRFGRNYKLQITANGLDITITPPLRISFDGEQSIYGDLNRVNISIYNLNENHRNILTKDPEDTALYYPLSLYVGYQDNLLLKFKGSIQSAYSSRSGTDFITKITCVDGMNDYLTSNMSGATTNMNDALADMTGALFHTDKGTVTVTRETTRPVVMVGNTIQNIKKHLMPDETLFIDKGKIHIINRKKDVVSDLIPVVSATTGLKSTPEIKNKLVSFTTILNPSIVLGGQIELQSTTAQRLNGIYRVETCSFKGDYMGSDWSETYECGVRNA